MGKTIEPRTFLRQQQGEKPSTSLIEPSDLLVISELNVRIPFAEVFEEQEFYQYLKKAVSEFNAGAALNGNAPADFDDLHTKYSEYLAALKSFQ